MKFIIAGLSTAWVAVLTLFVFASIYEYEVHFVLPDENIQTIKVEHNQTVEIIEVTNLAYEVIDWYTDEALTQVFNRDTKVTSELFLYAKVRYLKTHQVFFDLYDGEIKHDYQLLKVLDDNVIGSISFDPLKEGYNFIGWYRDSELTQRFNLVIDRVTADMTLYPKWEIKVFTVKFVDEANQTLKTLQVPYLSDVPVSEIPMLPEKEGYITKGWNQTLTQIKNDLIVAPVYEAIKYDLFVDINGIVSTYVFAYGDTITLDKPEKEGYQFIGWYHLVDGVEKLAPAKMPASDLNIYAKFDVLKYTVIFQVEGKLESQEVLHGQLPIIPDFSKEGYTLVWDKEITPITKDTTFNGTYTKNVHKLTIVLNNGQPNQVLEIAYGDPITLQTPTRDKHIFKAWLNLADHTPFTQTLMPNHDLSIYATWEELYYLIIDGKNLTPEGIKSGSNITNLLNSVKEKTGYTFIGFFYDTLFTDEFKSTVMPEDDLELFIKFEIKTFTVTLTYFDEIREFSVEYYRHIQIPEEFKTKHGYTLDGWYLGNNLYDLDRPVVEDTALVSKWTLNYYKVTYMNGLGITNPNTLTEFTVLTTDTLLDAEKLGYEFINWYTDDQFKNAFTAFKDYAEDLTLYPKFEIINYVITYELLADESNHPDNPTSYTIESYIDLKPASKTYFEFDGWLLNGEKVTEIPVGSMGDITLVPKFISDPLNKTITYDLQGKEIEENPNPTTYRVDEILLLVSPIGAGYEFIGWYLVPVPTETDSQISSTEYLTDDVLLYAVWGEVLSFTIDFNTYISTNMDQMLLEYGTSLSIPDLTQPNADVNEGQRVKRFEGWYLDAEYTLPFEYTKMPAKNLVLYAKWTSKYTVTFVSGIEEVADSYFTDYEGTLIAFPELSREGYEFDGYYLDGQFVNEFLDNAIPDSDIYIYFKWKPISLTITYETNMTDNSVLVDESGLYGQTIPDYPEAFLLEDKPYIFMGWFFDDVTFANEVNFITFILTEDITIYAKWVLPDGKASLTIDDDNGTDISVIELNWMETYNLSTLPTPFKPGYSFSHYKVIDSTGIDMGQQTSIVMKDHYYVVAQYIPNDIQVEIFVGSTLKFTINAKYDELLAKYLVMPEYQINENGYTVSKWFYDVDFVMPYDPYAPMKSDTRVYGKLEPALVRIKFDTNGGTRIPDKFAYIGDLLDFTQEDVPSKPGYTVLEYRVDNVRIDVFNYTVVGGVTIKVIWAPALYEFIMIDGGIATSKTYEYNQLIDRPPMYNYIPEKGYFAGWYLDEQFTELYVIDRYMDTQSITVYARWIPESHVSFYLHMGDGIFELVARDAKNSDNKIDEPIMNRYGYQIIDWYTDQNMRIPYDFNTEVVGTNLRLYSDWEPITYQVTLIIDDTEEVLNRKYNEKLNLPIPTKYGHDFSHWVDELGRPYTKDTMGYRDIRLTAVFEAVDYILRLNSTSGIFIIYDNLVQQEVTDYVFYVPFGATLEDYFRQLVIRKEKYLFAYWMEIGLEKFTLTEMPARDLNLRAQYMLHHTEGLVFTEIKENGEDAYAVTGYNGTDKNIVIPDFIYKNDNEVKVVRITVGAFRNKNQIESLRIGKYVTHIEQEAFMYNSRLTNVVFADDSRLKVIGASAFRYGSMLKSINFPESLEEIGAYAFENTVLTRADFGSKLEFIGNSAFRQSRLTVVTMPANSNLMIIQDDAFFYNPLTSITFGDKLETIGQRAFYNTDLTRFMIPNTVTSIGQYALYQNTRMQEIRVPSNITLQSIFGGVPNSLNKVTVFSSGSTSLVEYFAQNTRVAQVVLEKEITSIEQSAFNNAQSLQKINLENITAIRNYAFQNTYSLTEIDLSNVVTIGMNAFYNSSSLKEITSFNKLQNVQNNAFNNTSLKEVILPSIVSIGNGAFHNISSLTKIVLPLEARDVNNAFNGQNRFVQEIHLPGLVTLPNLFGGAGNLPQTLVDVYILEGSTQIAANFASNARYIVNVHIPNSIQSIGTNAFENASSIKELDFSQTSIKLIPNYAFRNTTDLTEIKLPKGVTSIGQDAFNQSGIRSFAFDENLTSIGNSAFYQSKIDEVVLTNKTTTIGNNAFANISTLVLVDIKSNYSGTHAIFNGSQNIKQLSFPGGVRLAQNGFANLNQLEKLIVAEGSTLITQEWARGFNAVEVIVPASVTSIETYAFAEMRKLVQLDLSMTAITELKNYVLQQTNTLEEVFLSNRVVKIGDYAFYQSGILRLTFPTALTSIGQNAFSNAKIEKILLPETVTSVGNGAFANNTSLTEVYLPSAMVITGAIFSGSNNIETITLPSKYTFQYYGLQQSTKLKSVTISNGTTDVVADFLNATNQQNLRTVTELVLADSLTSIGQNAFAYLGAAEVIFTSKITTIGNGAFANAKLETAILPDTLTTLGNSAFINATNLKEVYIPGHTTVQLLNTENQVGEVSRVLYNTPNLVKASVPGSKPGYYYGLHVSSVIEVYVSKGSTSIVAGFLDNTRNEVRYPTVRKVGMADTVLEIGADAFKGLPVNELELSSKLQSIGANAFSSTAISKFGYFMTDVYYENTFPESIKSVGESAFINTKLKGIIFPNVAVTILGSSFSNIVTLEYVTIPNLAVISNDILTGSFIGHANEKQITVSGSKTLAALGVSIDATPLKVTISDGTLAVVEDFAKDYINLYELTFNQELMTIGKNAFFNTRIQDLTVTPNVKTIGDLAFANNPNLRHFVMQGGGGVTIGLTILNNNTEIETLVVAGSIRLDQYYAELGNIQSLTRVTIAEGSTYIAERFALGYEYLRTVEMPASVNQIRLEAFKDSGVTYINLENVTTFNDEAFFNTRVSSINLSPDVINIGERAFGNIVNLTKVVMPDYLGAGNNMFEGSTNIIDLTIPSRQSLSSFGITTDNQSLTIIKITQGTDIIVSDWLNGFNRIENVVIPNSIKIIGSNAFKGTSIEKLVLPTELEIIQSGAFDTATLKEITLKHENPQTLLVHSLAFNSALEQLRVLEGTKGRYLDVIPASVYQKIVEVAS